MAWQFAAEDATVLAAGFGELAAQLGARGLADARDPVASVHAVLARFPAPWLLIFDNAADLASVAGFLPPAGPGRVLITSQNPNWPGQALEVPVLDPEVAAGFLVSRTGDPDRQAARDLAGELGGLPLALEQAAAYMQASGGTLAGYLALFRQRRAELLARGEPTGYSKTVASTWALAFDRLQQTAPGAVGLLRLLAFCAPEAIPLRLLLQPRPGLAEQLGEEVAPVLAPLLEDPLAAGDAIGALRRYSLVTPAADGSVSVHRLVQAVTADQMPAELARQWQQAAAALIEAAIPGDTDAAARPGRYARRCCRMPRRLSPMTAPGWRGSPPISDRAAVTPPPGISSGECLTHGSGSSARSTRIPWPPAQPRPLDRAGGGPGRGPGPVRRAAARARAGPRPGAPGHPGRPRQPRPLDRAGGGPGRGPGPVRRAAARARAGPRPGAPGHPGRPRTTSPAGPGRRETRPRPGTSSPRCCPCASGSSARSTRTPCPPARTSPSWTGEAGDAAAARDQFAALLPVRERVLGPEHPDTLTARATSPAGPGRRGTRPPPGTSSPRCCPCCERVLGPEHPRHPGRPRATSPAGPGRRGTRPRPGTSSPRCCPCSSGSSARSTRTPWPPGATSPAGPGEAGDPAAARDQFAALLPVCERVLGPEHPDTLTARATSPAGPGRRGTRPRPGTCTPRCCPCASGCTWPASRTP